MVLVVLYIVVFVVLFFLVFVVIFFLLFIVLFFCFVVVFGIVIFVFDAGVFMDGVIVIVFVFVIDGDVDPYQSKQGAKLELVPEHSCHVATFLPFANLDICPLVHFTALQFTAFCSPMFTMFTAQ